MTPGNLTASMEGADTLYNTFWIRFSRGAVDHDLAVHNTRNLVDAAVNAGVSAHCPHKHHRRFSRLSAALFSRQGEESRNISETQVLNIPSSAPP